MGDGKMTVMVIVIVAPPPPQDHLQGVEIYQCMEMFILFFCFPYFPLVA